MNRGCWSIFAVLAIAAGSLLGQTSVQQISVDARASGHAFPHFWEETFGSGRAILALRDNYRRDLKEVHDYAGMRYVRFHAILHDEVGVYDEDESGKPVYNFTYVDQIYDGLLDQGVRPFIEISFMPYKLASDPKAIHPFWYKQNVSPPKDYAKWDALMRAFAQHLVERYGIDEVSQWYFEVWNEPDIDYWHTTPEDYWKLYDYAVTGVRAALPRAKVGGPASTSPGRSKAYDFLKNFLQHVNTGKSAADGKPIPMDFISFHAKGSPTIAEGKVTMGISRELTDADKGFELISAFPRFKNLPIIISEADPEGCAACSSKVNPANNYRNGTLYPAYTATAFKALFELQDKHAVNLLSMLSWSFEFEDKDYFEGFRSLATNGVDKPVLNVFRMFGLMSGNRVQTTSTGKISLDNLVNSGARQSPDVDAFATKSDREAAVLVWNYCDVDGAAEAVPTAITIGGIPDGVHRVLLQHYRLDDTHSNSYTIWLAMGSPQHPTTEQYAKLQAAGQLQLLTSPKWVEVVNGQVQVDTDLPRQGTSLLRVQW